MILLPFIEGVSVYTPTLPSCIWTELVVYWLACSQKGGAKPAFDFKMIFDLTASKHDSKYRNAKFEIQALELRVAERRSRVSIFGRS